MFQQTNLGISFKIKIIPKASKSELVGRENDELKIRLAAVPKKGEANEELLRYLSKILETAKMNIQLIRGETSRHKCIVVDGMKTEEILAKIQHYLSKR